MAADSPLHDGPQRLRAGVRALWVVTGGAIASLGLALPADLAPPVPLAPIGGVTLARLGLGLSGLIAIGVGVAGWSPPRVAADDRLRIAPPVGGELRRPLSWLAAVTIVAAALRLHGIDQSLWFDEILTVGHAGLPFRELFTTSLSLNNHLLHTLLVRGAIGIAGHEEWAIRLPAVAFGVATIPAVYGLARVTLRPREAVLAALVLATTYSHVFTSQNSRGYAGFIFWTAVATWLLMRALAGDRARDWWGFAVASFLASATMILGGFTLAGQAAVVPLVAARVRRAGGRAGPIALKSLIVIGAVGLAVLDLYALSLPRYYQQVQPTGAPSGLPSPFWHNLRLGLGQAFSDAGLMVLLILVVFLAPGIVRFVRRHPTYWAYLVAPLATLGAAVLLMHLFVAPRYFVWAVVPFSVGVVGSAALWPRAARWAAPVVAGLVVTGSLVGLGHYYELPFQASRESVEWVLQETAREDVVVPITIAQASTGYYGRQLGLFRVRTVRSASSTEELREIERAYASRRVWLLTAGRGKPVRFQLDLAEYIDRCYRPVRTFPAKIMGITVWRLRCGAADDGPGSPPTDDIAEARSLP